MVGVRQCVSGFEAVDRALAVDQTKATGSSTWDLRAAARASWWPEGASMEGARGMLSSLMPWSVLAERRWALSGKW